jgi:multiple sugar transport system substrate-binding protein
VKLGLDTDAGKAAAQIIGDIGTSGVGGPGLPSEDEPASLTKFQGDSGSFMVNWPFVWSSTQGAVEAGSLDQSLLDDIGWALYPQTTEGEDARPPYGGISLGIGAFGKHTDLAYEAAQCIVSPENQAEYFVTNGNPAASIKAYDDPDVQEAFPMYDVIRDSLDQAAPRPQTPYYNEISTGLQQTWYPPASVDPDTTPQQSTEFITAVLRGERLL